MAKAGKIIKGSLAATLLAVAGAGLAWRGPTWYQRWSSTGEGGSRKEAVLRYHVVTRGELRVVINEEGKMRAIKSHAIYPEPRTNLKITWLATEGAKVKKGDLLASFDKKAFEDQLQARKADLEGARRSLTVAEEALKIQYKTAKSTVANAKTRLADAETALKIYKEMEGPKRLAELDSQINDAQSKCTAAGKALAEAQAKLDGELFMEEAQRKPLEKEVANAKMAADTARKTSDTTMLARKSYRAYDYPQNLRVKTAAVDNATIDLEKAEVQANSEILQKQAEEARVKEQINRLTRDITNLEDSINKCELRAPVDGLVIYGDPNQGYYGGNREIKVGTDWYGGNTLMTIPDLSAFEVDFRIPEEMRGRVKAGCPAVLSVSAVPDLSIGGTLKKIGDMGQPRTPWDPSSPRTYPAVIALNEHDERLVSGMTVKVQIVADVLKDVLLVPIEAVFNDNGQTICYVQNGVGSERRQVKPGKCSDHFAQIVDGLSEGETVDLTPTPTTSVAKKAGG